MLNPELRSMHFWRINSAKDAFCSNGLSWVYPVMCLTRVNRQFHYRKRASGTQYKSLSSAFHLAECCSVETFIFHTMVETNLTFKSYITNTVIVILCLIKKNSWNLKEFVHCLSDLVNISMVTFHSQQTLFSFHIIYTVHRVFLRDICSGPTLCAFVYFPRNHSIETD